MRIGELLGVGRSADVYAIGGGRVLRRYRYDLDAGRESAVMAYVAAHGYPVPEVFPGEGRATDLVMGLVWGPTLLQAFTEGKVDAGQVGRILAGLLRRLHEIPPMEPGGPGDRILHLDLHPDNVMLAPQGPVVIDWANSRPGPPALDCALSALIIAQVAVDEELGRPEEARAALAALVAELGDDLDVGDPLDEAEAIRDANRTLSDRELGLLDEAVALVRELAS
ncbi:phosphotransferase [Nonomuraea maheshkhaliensis]|uniref:Phosphotransferase n=1 Tax=Nonomuraea maheshkhaliensis TaxID=419590 RepID=A0ABN2H1W2_9ACTN